MTHTEAEEVAKTLMMGAQQNLMQHDALQPVLIVLAAGVPNILPLPMANDRDKDRLETVIPEAIEAMQGEAAFVITDGWRKDPKTMQRIGEVVTVAIATPGAETCLISEYTRDKQNKPVFSEPKLAQGEMRFLHNAFRNHEKRIYN